MDQSAPYQPHHRQQLFPQGGQLPPPSSLMPSFSRTGTLPPLPSITQQHAHMHDRSGGAHPPDARYPPPSSYHPSLATPTSSTSPASAGHPPPPWPTHRTSSSRDEVHPSVRRRESKGKLLDGPGADDGLHEQTSSANSRHVQPPDPPKETDDGMSSTSDFVKKLYK